MEIQVIDTSFVGALFNNPITHLTGGPGVGKSLLLLWYLGHRVLQREEGILWIDAGGSFPPARVKVLFGQDAPTILSHIMVAKANSLMQMKTIVAEVASSGVPPGTGHVVVDPVSRWPRLALTRTTRSPGQVEFVAEDFFANVVEPLFFAGARDGFRAYFVHENSQDHPFWWDRYPARDCRVHVLKDARHPLLRQVCNVQMQPVAILDLGANPIGVVPPHLIQDEKKREENLEG
jgi:hypothetical protein